MRVWKYLLVGIPIYLIVRFCSDTFDAGFFVGCIVNIIWQLIDEKYYPLNKK